MRAAFISLLAGALAALASGCVGLEEIRIHHAPITLASQPDEEWLGDCHPGRADANAPAHARHSLEDYGGYLIGYAEFDDQGWNSGVAGRGGQVQALMDALDAEAARNDELLVLVFVHGWHHNAHDNDCNVRQFRTLVKEAARYTGHPGHARKVVGVYVGWRGESLDAPYMRHATIYTRKITAEHIAKGSVRELFARLKLFETRQRRIDDRRVRTVVIGHSFGGLIAFHSLAQSMLEDIVFGNIKCKAQNGLGVVKTESESPSSVAAKWSFPDFTILVNPAFEASRYEALFQATLLDGDCSWDQRRPRMITLTADNDVATGVFFPPMRRLATIFERYGAHHSDDERSANISTVGFVDRYRTHRLRECLVDGRKTVVMQPEYAGPARDPYSPLVAARAPKGLLDGHDGFLYSPTENRINFTLLHFLIDLYRVGLDHVGAERCERGAAPSG